MIATAGRWHTASLSQKRLLARALAGDTPCGTSTVPRAGDAFGAPQITTRRVIP